MFPGFTHDGTRKDKHQFLSATAASIEHVGAEAERKRKSSWETHALGSPSIVGLAWK